MSTRRSGCRHATTFGLFGPLEGATAEEGRTVYATRFGPNIKKVDHQQIARLGALDTDRPGEKMHNGQIDVADIVGGFVVLDEAPGPVIGLDHEVVAGLDPGHDRDVRVPAVVDHVVLVGRLAEIDLDQRLRLPRQRTASRHYLIHRLYSPLKLTRHTARNRAIAASST